jgi:hypothetical protein
MSEGGQEKSIGIPGPPKAKLEKALGKPLVYHGTPCHSLAACGLAPVRQATSGNVSQVAPLKGRLVVNTRFKFLEWLAFFAVGVSHFELLCFQVEAHVHGERHFVVEFEAHVGGVFVIGGPSPDKFELPCVHARSRKTCRSRWRRSVSRQ